MFTPEKKANRCFRIGGEKYFRNIKEAVLEESRLNEAKISRIIRF